MKHKLLPKNNIILFQHIPIYFRRFPKTTEYIRRCPMKTERKNPKIFKEQIRIDNAKRL